MKNKETVIGKNHSTKSPIWMKQQSGKLQAVEVRQKYVANYYAATPDCFV